MAEDDVTAAVESLTLARGTDLEAVDPNADPDGRYVEWTQRDGEVARWRLADEIGVLPLMLFARQANAGMDTNDLDALEVMFQLLQDCIDPRVFRGFVQWGTREKLQADDIFKIVQQAWQVISGNPTVSPSDSSPGSSTTSPSSNETSGGRVSRRQPGRGRRPVEKVDPHAELKRELGIVPIAADLAAER